MIYTKPELNRLIQSGNTVSLNKLQLLYLFGGLGRKAKNTRAAVKSMELTEEAIEMMLTDLVESKLKTWCDKNGFIFSYNKLQGEPLIEISLTHTTPIS